MSWGVKRLSEAREGPVERVSGRPSSLLAISVWMRFGRTGLARPSQDRREALAPADVKELARRGLDSRDEDAVLHGQDGTCA